MITLYLKDSQKARILIAKSGNDLKSFSEETDISYSYLVNILNEKNNPSIKTANKITSALGLSLADLFNIKATMKKK